MLKSLNNCFIDKDILKIRDDLRMPTNLFSFLNSHIYKLHSKNNEIYNCNKNKTQYNEVTYLSNDNNILLFHIVFEREYEYLNMYGAISMTAKKYLFAGVQNSHPFLFTHNYSYGNSDGSGPDFPNCDETDDIEILYRLKKYHGEFMQNKYH